MSYLDWLDERGFPFNLEYLKEPLEETPLDPDDVDAVRKLKEKIGQAASQVVEHKIRPAKDLREDLKGFLDEVSQAPPILTGGDPLDAYFTRAGLREVPHIVARLRSLPEFCVDVIPSDKVVNYFQQACICYIFGLYTASVALSRVVLEAALNEVLIVPNTPAPSPDVRKDFLKSLVKWAGMTKVLQDESLRMAHRIRTIGNKALHQGICTESKARDAVEEAM